MMNFSNCIDSQQNDTFQKRHGTGGLLEAVVSAGINTALPSTSELKWSNPLRQNRDPRMCQSLPSVLPNYPLRQPADATLRTAYQVIAKRVNHEILHGNNNLA